MSSCKLFIYSNNSNKLFQILLIGHILVRYFWHSSEMLGLHSMSPQNKNNDMMSKINRKHRRALYDVQTNAPTHDHKRPDMINVEMVWASHMCFGCLSLSQMKVRCRTLEWDSRYLWLFPTRLRFYNLEFVVTLDTMVCDAYVTIIGDNYRTPVIRLHYDYLPKSWCHRRITW